MRTDLSLRHIFPLVVALLALSLPAAAATNELVSVATDGSQATALCGLPWASADGRWVAFVSTAGNLAPGDTNAKSDIFVRDRLLGVTVRVSVATDGTQADGDSTNPCLSGDGRYVAFESIASNLVADDTNGVQDVFVHDLATGVTERVSVPAGGGEPDRASREARLSGDGRYVVFTSSATNLVPGDVNGRDDVFLYDRLAGALELVSVSTGGAQGNGLSARPFITPDGRFVAFHSDAGNLVAGDTNARRDVFLRDRLLGTTERVSLGAAGQGNGPSQEPALSADGLLVAFSSTAGNLVTGDTNGQSDVFVRDRLLSTTECASVTSAGALGAGASGSCSLSADGRYVAFSSLAVLTAGDTNNTWDIMLRDRLAATTERVSITNLGLQANGASLYPCLDAAGLTVVFQSGAPNLVEGDANGQYDVFARGPLRNSPPVAGADTATTDELTPVTIAVLANDTDPDLDPLAIESITQPVYGTAAVVGSAVVYTPSGSYRGDDRFTYTVIDGKGGSATGLVTVSVIQSNRPPVLLDPGDQSVAEGQLLSFALSASDPDGDTLTYTATGLPTGAALDPTAGVFAWTPAAGQAGTYPVTFTASDGLLSASASTTITVVYGGNTPAGDGVTTELPAGISLTFTEVTAGGDTSLTGVSTRPPGRPTGFRFLNTYFDIVTTAEYTGPVTVTIAYDPAAARGAEKSLKIFHERAGGGWEDVTVSVDTVNHTVTGRVAAL